MSKASGSAAHRSRTALVCLLTALCMATTYFFHLRLREDVFSHLFYVPIVLGGIWWGWRSIAVAAVLAGNLLASHLVALSSQPLGHDLVRAAMLLLVGAVVGLAVEQRRRQEGIARAEHRQRVEQMRLHLDYVGRVSHELRNPLQVSLGVLDLLAAGGGPEERERLMGMLDRNLDRIRVRIAELTTDARPD